MQTRHTRSTRGRNGGWVRFYLFFWVVIMPWYISTGEVTYVPKPAVNDPFASDSLFVGASVVVLEPAVPVVVEREGSIGTDGVGQLYVVLPEDTDSLRPLFHNLAERFPEEPSQVNLGPYPAGTELVFCYVVVDAAPEWASYTGKRLFTGQNRDSLDAFVSEREWHYFGRRFAAVGRIDSLSVEVGFTDRLSTCFWSMYFTVENVKLTK